MAQTRGGIEYRVKELESRLPVAFGWFSGPTQPGVGVQGVTFWEDRSEDVGKILMRRKNKVYVITGYPYDPGSNITILPNAHAHRHATGNSLKADVGADPLGPYSFSWLNTHTFARSSNVVSIKVDPSGASGEDSVQFLDDSGSEKFVFTTGGLLALGGATEDLPLNVRGGDGAPTPVAPDAIATPKIWMRIDDIDQLDNTTTAVIPERETSNTLVSWTNGPTNNAGGGVVDFRTAASAEGMGGHDCIVQKAIATDLSLNGIKNSTDGDYNTEVEFTGAFTALAVYSWNSGYSETPGDFAAIAGSVNGASKSGLVAHGLTTLGTARLFTNDGSLNNIAIGSTIDDDTKGIRIAIFRRNASPSTTIRYYATNNKSDTQVERSTTHADVAALVDLNSLIRFSNNDANASPPGFKIAEFVAWDSELTDDEVLQLYQFYAQRFSLTELTTGGESAQVRLEVDASNYTYLKNDVSGNYSITPSGGNTSVVGNLAVGSEFTPSAITHVLGTTEQLRIGYDSINYVAATVDSAGSIALDTAGAGTSSTSYLFGTGGSATPGIHTRWTGAADAVLMDLDENGVLYSGDSASGDNYWSKNDTATWTADHTFESDVYVDGVLYGPAAATSMVLSSRTTTGGGQSFVFDISGASVPTVHSRWQGDADAVLMELDENGVLYKGAVASSNEYWAEDDTATWDGQHTFNEDIFALDTITGPASTSPLLFKSRTTDGASNTDFTFDSTIAKTTGNAFKIINSADNVELLTIDWDGKVQVGYDTGLSGFPGTLLSFTYADGNQDVLTTTGMAGALRHTSSVVTPSRFAGVVGGVDLLGTGSPTVPSANFMYGVCGAGISSFDNAFAGSSKVLAGVVGTLGYTFTNDQVIPNAPDRGVWDDQSVAGNWAHAACIWGNALMSWQYPTSNPPPNPTNMPSIVSCVKASIPEITDGECWGYFLNIGDDLQIPPHPTFSSYYTPIAAAVVGAYRVPWPRHGTRRVHMYFIPGAQSDTTGNVAGDLIFHDGSGGVDEGLYEHDGTDWYKLLTTKQTTPVVTTITATSYTILNTDDIIWVDDDTAGAEVTITLPTPTAGAIFTIMKRGSTANVVVDTTSGVINGESSKTLTQQYSTMVVVSNGTDWGIT